MTKVILSAFADEASPNLSEQIVALKKAGIPCVELRGEIRARLVGEGRKNDFGHDVPPCQSMT